LLSHHYCFTIIIIMGRLFKKLKKVFGEKEDVSSGEEVIDEDAIGLSHVGHAAYEVLRKKHNSEHHGCWDVTFGHVVGELDQTPKGYFDIPHDPGPGHSDWFPKKLGEIMSRTEHWCDVMSLGPPDGKFFLAIKSAIEKINENAQGKDKPVVIRLLFGNIIGMPVRKLPVVEFTT
jgi:hypothetical protein